MQQISSLKQTSKSMAYRGFRLRIIIACVALAALFISGLAWKAYSDFQSAKAGIVAQTGNLVQAIEAHVIDSIESLAGPLRAGSVAVAALAKAGPLSTSNIAALLTTPLLPPSASYWVMFVDREGMGVAASNGLEIAGVSYADREYFKAHAGSRLKNLGSGLYVGSPAVGRVSHKKIFFVSRRVESDTGEFLGVLVACVDASSIAKVLALSQYQPNLSITMLNIDGRIIARVPLYTESFALDISKSELFVRLAKASKGSYQARSFVDNEERIYSYRSIDAYPLVVIVGIASSTFMEIFVRDIWQISVGSILLLLVFVLGSNFALRSFREVQEAEERQKSLNHELKNAKDSIESSERRARMIADNMPALVAYIDADQRYQFRNSYYKNIPGVDYESMIGKTMREVFGDASYALISFEVDKALLGESLTFDRDRQNMDGTLRSLRYQYSPDIQPDGSVAGFYTLVADVTDMKTIQRQLMALARIDSLTGLPNRTFLYERMEEAIARSVRLNFSRADPSRLGCLFLDIDHFKNINDTFGHAGGDDVLKEFGERLKKCVRQTDMVARLAGDEFVILLEGIEQPHGAEIVAAKIIAAMVQPFIVDHSSIAVTTSIGISVFSEPAGGADFMLRQADEALYEAKRTGRNRFSLCPEAAILYNPTPPAH